MKRKCPSCNEKGISTSELEKNEYCCCFFCGVKVEKWFSFSIFISIITGFGAYLAFKNSYMYLGSILFCLSFAYYLFYSKINAFLMPLKVY